MRVDPAIGAAGDIDTAVVTLRHVSGCLTVIDNSRRAVYGYDQRVEAFGSGGVAASDNPPVYTTTRQDAAGGHTPPIGVFFLDRYEVSYRDQWAAFVAAVAGGGPSPVPGADGRAALATALAAEESLRTGTTTLVCTRRRLIPGGPPIDLEPSDPSVQALRSVERTHGRSSDTRIGRPRGRVEAIVSVRATERQRGSGNKRPAWRRGAIVSVRAIERQRGSGTERPAWPGNASDAFD